MRYPSEHLLPSQTYSVTCWSADVTQVVSGADDSSVAVWDVETGAKSMLFEHAHGDYEITCMSFDANYRKLYTGARNGTVKVRTCALSLLRKGSRSCVIVASVATQFRFALLRHYWRL